MKFEVVVDQIGRVVVCRDPMHSVDDRMEASVLHFGLGRKISSKALMRAAHILDLSEVFPTQMDHSRALP